MAAEGRDRFEALRATRPRFTVLRQPHVYSVWVGGDRHRAGEADAGHAVASQEVFAFARYGDDGGCVPGVLRLDPEG